MDPEANQSTNDLLNSIFGRKKKKYEDEIKEEFRLEFKVITAKEQAVDYSHKIVLKEKDFLNLFRYIRSLKKQIAKLKRPR